MRKFLKFVTATKTRNNLGQLSLDQVAQISGGDGASWGSCVASCGSQTTREGTIRCLEKCK